MLAFCGCEVGAGGSVCSSVGCSAGLAWPREHVWTIEGVIVSRRSEQNVCVWVGGMNWYDDVADQENFLSLSVQITLKSCAMPTPSSASMPLFQLPRWIPLGLIIYINLLVMYGLQTSRTMVVHGFLAHIQVAYYHLWSPMASENTLEPVNPKSSTTSTISMSTPAIQTMTYGGNTRQNTTHSEGV